MLRVTRTKRGEKARIISARRANARARRGCEAIRSRQRCLVAHGLGMGLGDADETVTARALDDPDALPLGDAFFGRAKLLRPPALGKKHTGLRIDADVLGWFKAQSKGWQTRMNAVLRAYMESRNGGRRRNGHAR